MSGQDSPRPQLAALEKEGRKPKTRWPSLLPKGGLHVGVKYKMKAGGASSLVRVAPCFYHSRQKTENPQALEHF